MSQIHTAILKFITTKKYIPRDAEALRGAFGHMYREESIFHNHDENGKEIYRMPLIQYRIINSTLSVIAYNEGIPVLGEKFLQIKSFNLKGQKVENFEISFTTKNENFMIDEGEHHYRFISPWLGVNQENYAAFKDRAMDFNKILQNNILSNFKGLGILVKKRIHVKGHYHATKAMIKDVPVTGLKGIFVCNVKIPDYMCFGKRRSIGFGCVEGV